MDVASEYQKLKQSLETFYLSRAEAKQSIVDLIQQRRVEHTEMNLRDSKENGLPDLWTLPKKLTIVISARDYLQNLKDLHLAVKDVEQATREVKTRLENDTIDEEQFSQILAVVCNALASCGGLESNIKPLPLELQGTQLESFANELLEKLQTCRKSIGASCDELVSQHLKLCGWPPSFASPTDDPPSPNFWSVLISENQNLFSKLESSLIKLTKLQQAIDGRTLNGKILWFIQHLVQPLEDRLKHHFGSQTMTSDISKPDWLFHTALKIIQRFSMGMQYFHGVLKACDLDGLFDLEIEFMRCMQLSVQSIIEDFHLPKLFAAGSGALWITWVESTKKFDRDVMEMIGITPEAGDLWEQYLETGCIRVFFKSKDWLVAWCNSEVEDSIQRLDELMLQPNAWDEGPSMNGSMASHEEIWPPKFAEEAWGVFISLIQKSKGLPQECIETWLKRVGKPFLMDFGRRLSSKANTNDGFKGLLERSGASKVCAIVCGANFFVHGLSEWSEFENSTNVSRELLNHVFSKETNNFSSVRKEWCMKTAREIAIQFNNDLHDYKKSLHIFAKLETESGQGHNPSTTFVPALLKLREVLEIFSGMADAVCFREIWKAVAYGIVRILFNDVLTEAKFSAWGGAQLQSDVYTLMDVFGSYTSRPHTHFKELHEACLLLTMPKENVDYIKKFLMEDAKNEDFQSYLRQCGLSILEPDQMLCIVDERMSF